VLDNLPVRVGSPRGVVGRTDTVASPVFATGVGLAILAARDAETAAPAVGAPGAGVIARLRRWIERVLPRA
jgi:cell division ATPase FtsA